MFFERNEHKDFPTSSYGRKVDPYFDFAKSDARGVGWMCAFQHLLPREN